MEVEKKKNTIATHYLIDRSLSDTILEMEPFSNWLLVQPVSLLQQARHTTRLRGVARLAYKRVFQHAES